MKGFLDYVYVMDWFEAEFHLTFTGLTPEIHPDAYKQGPQRCLSTWMNYKMLVACVQALEKVRVHWGGSQIPTPEFFSMLTFSVNT